MNKKLKFHIWSQWGVLGLIMLLAVGLIAVKAYTNYGASQPASVIENAENVTINQAVTEIPPAQESLGAISDATNLPRMMCTGGECTATFSGDLQDATTTIVSFASPFTRATSSAADVVIRDTTNNGYGLTAATSTVDLVRLQITTAATSTYSVSCGASTGYSTADSVSLLDTATGGSGVATSTAGTLENKLTAALGGALDAGTVEKITLNGTHPYFTCTITTPTAYASNFTGAANTFDGQYTVTIHNAR